MSIHTNLLPTSLLGTCLLAMLAGCGEKPQDTAESATAIVPQSATIETVAEAPTKSTYQAPLPGTGLIPYPLYPNATKYRIGGENGLKIVVFETEDSFENVDEFFQHSPAKVLARLQGMEQYVKYALEATDNDPWATDRPGIVIHDFADVDEAIQFGAAPESRTNIIMSYR
ncbi:MAG: hypothetical protein KTR32_22275 [Granulosicoccus sp.]|nr:hypothetical protein [Granulosicoccus sp.]